MRKKQRNGGQNRLCGRFGHVETCSTRWGSFNFGCFGVVASIAVERGRFWWIFAKIAALGLPSGGGGGGAAGGGGGGMAGGGLRGAVDTPQRPKNRFPAIGNRSWHDLEKSDFSPFLVDFRPLDPAYLHLPTLPYTPLGVTELCLNVHFCENLVKMRRFEVSGCIL